VRVDQPSFRIAELRTAAASLFAGAFGLSPTSAAHSPGRVNLIGDHVDYCGGVVLPIAIDAGIVACARLRDDRLLRAISRERPSEAVRTETDDPRWDVPDWGRYVLGVWAKINQLGVALPGADIALASDLQAGAGLSSSAAVEVATALALLQAAQRTLPGSDIIRICRDAERDHAGVPCGIMDQYAVMCARGGSAVLLDCHVETHRHIAVGAAASIIIVDSGVKRALADGRYGERRDDCARALAGIVGLVGPRATLRHVTPAELEAARPLLSDFEHRRARHVVTEIARTLAAAAALERGDLPSAGRLMTESHASLRDDFAVSHPAVDELVQSLVAQPGTHGARMTGGGFGGCVVALADADAASRIVADLAGTLPTDRLCRIVIPSPPASTIPTHDHPARADRLCR